MLFVSIKGYHSKRETIIELLANAHKLSHLGLRYLVRWSSLSEANAWRTGHLFEDIYISKYHKNTRFLADIHLGDADMKQLYIMDSTITGLFKDLLHSIGRNPKKRKKKGGIKAHTIIWRVIIYLA